MGSHKSCSLRDRLHCNSHSRMLEGEPSLLAGELNGDRLGLSIK